MEPKLPSIKGDLIQMAKAGRFNVIVHGCNCFHTMGAGIAQQVAGAFPEAVHADLATEYAARHKLGMYSVATVGALRVVNAYTQYRFRGRGNVDYSAIQKVFGRIARDFRGQRIGVPRIGAGLAGGDWKKIEQIIANETLGRVDLTVVEYIAPRRPDST